MIQDPRVLAVQAALPAGTDYATAVEIYSTALEATAKHTRFLLGWKARLELRAIAKSMRLQLLAD